MSHTRRLINSIFTREHLTGENISVTPSYSVSPVRGFGEQDHSRCRFESRGNVGQWFMVSSLCRIAVRGVFAVWIVLGTQSAIVSHLVGLRLSVGNVWGQEGRATELKTNRQVTIDIDQGAVRKLAVVKDYLSDQQWNQAIDLLRNIVDQHRGSLVPISPGRFVNARYYCQGLLSELAPEGLTEHRRQIDPQVKLWYEEWERQRDESQLMKIARQGFAGQAGDLAIWTLGELAWERGEFSSARSWWMHLLPAAATPVELSHIIDYRFPGARYAPADVLARVVLCRIFEGENEQADRELAAFRHMFPDAEGKLAGREGNLADLLDELMKERLTWSSHVGRESSKTFAGNSQRQYVVDDWDTLGVPLWKYDLPALTIGVNPPSKSALSNQPLSVFPVGTLVGSVGSEGEASPSEIVLINDLDRVLAFRLRDGQPVWPIDNESSPVLYPETPSAVSLSPDFPVIGSPRFTLTVHRGKLYGRLGTPITSVSPHENRLLRNEIICLDLERGEGKLVWNFPSNVLDRQTPEWLFEGTPIAWEDRIYIVTRRGSPENQLGIACLTADEGELLWLTPVCAAIRASEADSNQITSLHMARDGHNLYLCTDFGAVVSLDAFEGTIQWVSLYDNPMPMETNQLLSRWQHGLKAPLIYHDKLIVSPTGERFIAAYDTHTGRSIWTRQFNETISHLLGVVGETLIASGNSLWGLDVNSGRVIWRIGFEDPAGYGFGRGLLTPTHVLWPTHDELLLVDHANGAIDRRYPIRAQYGVSGGNLFAMDHCLIIAEPNRLVCFGPREWAQPRKLPEDLLSILHHNIESVTQTLQNSHANHEESTSFIALDQRRDDFQEIEFAAKKHKIRKRMNGMSTVK